MQVSRPAAAPAVATDARMARSSSRRTLPRRYHRPPAPRRSVRRSGAVSVRATRGQLVAARDRAALRNARRARERVSLSSQEIDLRIESAIIEAVIARGTVSEADLVRANIPPRRHHRSALHTLLRLRPPARSRDRPRRRAGVSPAELFWNALNARPRLYSAACAADVLPWAMRSTAMRSAMTLVGRCSASARLKIALSVSAIPSVRRSTSASSQS